MHNIKLKLMLCHFSVNCEIMCDFHVFNIVLFCTVCPFCDVTIAILLL